MPFPFSKNNYSEEEINHDHYRALIADRAIMYYKKENPCLSLQELAERIVPRMHKPLPQKEERLAERIAKYCHKKHPQASYRLILSLVNSHLESKRKRA